ncbi:MAG: hypothetical protein PHS44_00725 [Candidatus Dojkabacteria bacterium]|jgi:tRNA A-37 threonylcarbamoyl transferase component Bud32|nr:hypothetical protein [Candidatus Dojkabacteria bacterium]
MNRNKYIHNVRPSLSPIKVKNPVFEDSKVLEKFLEERLGGIKLGKVLKGGIVSRVYEAYWNDQKVVVKHTEDFQPQEPTMFFESRRGHNLDTRILKRLAQGSISAPKVFRHFPNVTTTVLEDLGESGYRLLSNIILSRSLRIESAEKVGRELARLIKITRQWNKFYTEESAEQCFYERSLEMRLLLPESAELHEDLRKEFTGNNKYLNWPDGDPKNIFIKDGGECCFIDFGRSNFSDQRYILANFLAHILLYSLAGYIPKKLGIAYFEKCFESYMRILPVDEDIFTKYLGMEVLHRSCGKWIKGIYEHRQKLQALKFGMTVFENKINTIDRLIHTFAEDEKI